MTNCTFRTIITLSLLLGSGIFANNNNHPVPEAKKKTKEMPQLSEEDVRTIIKLFTQNQPLPSLKIDQPETEMDEDDIFAKNFVEGMLHLSSNGLTTTLYISTLLATCLNPQKHPANKIGKAILLGEALALLIRAPGMLDCGRYVNSVILPSKIKKIIKPTVEGKYFSALCRTIISAQSMLNIAHNWNLMKSRVITKKWFSLSLLGNSLVIFMQNSDYFIGKILEAALKYKLQSDFETLSRSTEEEQKSNFN